MEQIVIIYYALHILLSGHNAFVSYLPRSVDYSGLPGFLHQ